MWSAWYCSFVICQWIIPGNSNVSIGSYGPFWLKSRRLWRRFWRFRRPRKSRHQRAKRWDRSFFNFTLFQLNFDLKRWWLCALLLRVVCLNVNEHLIFCWNLYPLLSGSLQLWCHTLMPIKISYLHAILISN